MPTIVLLILLASTVVPSSSTEIESNKRDMLSKRSYNYNNRGNFMSNSTLERSAGPDARNNNNPFRPAPFYISRMDVESRRSFSTLPIILPAVARLTPAAAGLSHELIDDELDLDEEDQVASEVRGKKRKKNFTQLAKNLMNAANAARGVKSSALKSAADMPKAARSYTTPKKRTKQLIELNGYCGYRSDGLYEDPNECENFIICFAGRTFKTRCAYGTSWNHIRKECDFHEKVDCERKASTTTEEISTTTTPDMPLSTTPVFAPKLSAYTVRNNHRGSASTSSYMDRGILASLRINILLTVILVPTLILIVALVVCTLCYWRRKFRLERHRLDFSNSVKLSSACDRKESELSHRNSAVSGQHTATGILTNTSGLGSTSNCEKKRSKLLEKLSCLTRIWERLSHHKQFRPKLIMSCAGGGGGTSAPNSSSSQHRFSNINHIDLVRGQITSSSASSHAAAGNQNPVAGLSNSSKLLNQSITVNYPLKGAAPNDSKNPQRLSLVDVCNHHASQSHITLSSHFEENNWDYNFATRGLYFSQPWVRGRYTHTLGSESMAATSGVLTLDPTTELSLEINRPTTTASNGARFIDIYGETGGSDTDGYYA